MALALVAATTLAWWWFRDFLQLETLAKRESELRAWREGAPLQAAAAAWLTYLLVAGLSLPGATLLTLLIGWFFGFWQGLVIVSLGSTCGATVAFLLTRYLFRDWAHRRLQQTARGRRMLLKSPLQADAGWYLFTLRLIPAVPFFVINALMGLTEIRTVPFFWISLAGMFPATVVYVHAGATLPGLGQLADQGFAGILSWQLLTAFAMLGLLPLVARRLAKRWSRDGDAVPESGNPISGANRT